MDKSYEIKYHKLEEKNWWFKARRNTILHLIQKIGVNKNAKILDIGCSGGLLIKFLAHKGFLNIYGIDISENAIDLCKERGIKNVKVMDGTKLLFNDNEFDLVIASDVLEHIEEDSAALLEWYRVLKPNGKLIVMVPAFDFLWSSHDKINHHYRRYPKLDLKKKVKKANFKIMRISCWNFFLFFPTVVVRLLQRFYNKKNELKDQLYQVNPLINKILANLLKVEDWFLNFLNFPLGVSIF